MSIETELPRIGVMKDGTPVSIDLPALIVSRLIVTGNSGAGKSRTLRRLIEQTHGLLPQFIIDPEDEFFSLREKFNFVLLGGADADCPIHPDSAFALAQKAMQLGISMVLSLADMELDDRFRFITNFIRGLMDIPRAQRRSAMIVIDESDIYAPEGCEKVNPDKCGPAGHVGLAMVDLAIRGRKRGLCPVYATNRVSLVSATVRAACVTKLVGRQSMDIDVQRAGKDLGLRDRRALMALQPGQFFATGPGFGLNSSVETIMVGDVATTHPQPGHHQGPPPPPPAEVAAILAELVRAVDAEPKPSPAGGPCSECAALRTAIARMEQEHADQIGACMVDAREDFLVEINRLAGYEPTGMAMTRPPETARLPANPEPIGLVSEGGSVSGPPVETKRDRSMREHVRNVDAPAPAPAPSAKRDPMAGFPNRPVGMARDFLRALAQHRTGLSKRQVLLYAGYAQSGHSSKAFAGLARTGFAETRAGVNGGVLCITDDGLRALGSYEPLPTGEDLFHRLVNSGHLSEMERAFLRYLHGLKHPAAKSLILTATGYAQFRAFIEVVRAAGTARLCEAREWRAPAGLRTPMNRLTRNHIVGVGMYSWLYQRVRP